MFQEAVLGWRRRLRWMFGAGWSAKDFARRYAGGAADAWGYRDSALHARRAELIVAALPQPRFALAFEAGCAQGFLSLRLAARADRLIACDLSAAAVREARAACADIGHAEFCVGDIRDGLPADRFDLCVFSDVLYYLTARETNAVLAETARRIAPGGALVAATAWGGARAGLTPPSYPLARLDAAAGWRRVSFERAPLGDAELWIAVHRRIANT